MTKRIWTENSKNYINEWLKNEYKTNPQFKQKRDDYYKFYMFKKRVNLKTDMLLLDVVAEQYQTKLFT